jgi:hypothetical protein
LLFPLLAATMFVDSLLGGPTATLTGRVTDTTGAIIVDVQVDATNVETNVTFPGVTNEQGLYNIPNLPPGTYRVVVQKFAFRTVVKPAVELHVQDVIALNFSMEIGSIAESVTVEAGAPLIQPGPQRGGGFSSREVRDLPLAAMSPISLARTLPGTIEPAGSTLYPGIDMYEDQPVTLFSVNGQRTRANNYLLDSTENNDIMFSGLSQRFNIADAVAEVSVQTSNFGVEFGRAGGGVLNIVTKSGTNSLHGTLLWRYQSQRFNSVSNVAKLNQTPKSVFARNVYGFTVGGPVRNDKTFFFAAFQQDTRRSTQNYPLVVPTEAAVSMLRSLFPSNPRLDFYLRALGNLRGSANPIPLQLGVDPLTGADRGIVQFASAPLAVIADNGGPQWLARLDHNRSEEHRLALRYVYDGHTNSPIVVHFPGFITDQSARKHNVLFTDQYTFSSSWTNEFRFSYARQDADQPYRISPQSLPEAHTQPRINISSIDSPGIPSDFLQFRHVNNFLFQEKQTKLNGRHTFNYGVEFLAQLATQRPSAVYLGTITYADTPALGYSGFANFLDDFSGTGSVTTRDFGATLFHPNQFRQTYFFQDMWLAKPSLSLTLGMRYENFGQVANTLRFPAFAGFDPNDFLKPSRVNNDNNNFGPAFGFAWSPVLHSGWLHKLFGENKMVWRGGFQISYDAFVTQMVSLSLASSPPNASKTTVPADRTGRGTPKWSEQLPTVEKPPSPMDPQAGVLQKDFRSPYTERWSFGFQRQLSNRIVIDGSYVGSQSHKLTTWDEANPLVNPLDSSGRRLYPEVGRRAIRTSQGNSSYHAMQWRVDRRFGRGFQVTGSYTWSRNIDSTSEGVGGIAGQSSINNNRTSIDIARGGLKLDRGPSDFDRTHRLSVLYVWELPSPGTRFLKYSLGGWSIAGITALQSGAPFTVLNRTNSVRPDIGNPNAPLNSRAIVFAGCSSGYKNPDTDACVTSTDVHWIENRGLPNANTIGRNTLVAGGINNFDLKLSKSFQISEQKRVEFRWEALNVLNHPQFTQFPERDVTSLPSVSGSPSHFLNRDFTDSGIRTMWVQLKVLF